MQGTGRKIILVANMVRIITLVVGVLVSIVGFFVLFGMFVTGIILLISGVLFALIGYVNSLFLQGYGEIVISLSAIGGTSVKVDADNQKENIKETITGMIKERNYQKEIENIRNLRKKGFITEIEYEDKMKEILSRK